CLCFFFSSRRRHTRSKRDWSSDVCSSDLQPLQDLGLNRRLTKQSASPPATAFSLLFSIDRLIAHFSATVAFEFTRYSRWRAIHRSEERRVGKESRRWWSRWD